MPRQTRQTLDSLLESIFDEVTHSVNRECYADDVLDNVTSEDLIEITENLIYQCANPKRRSYKNARERITEALYDLLAEEFDSYQQEKDFASHYYYDRNDYDSLGI